VTTVSMFARYWSALATIVLITCVSCECREELVASRKGLPSDTSQTLDSGEKSTGAAKATTGRTHTNQLPLLRSSGTRIVSSEGRDVLLRGCNLGSWLLIEPWMIGIEGDSGIVCEKDIWDTAKRLGGGERMRAIASFYRNNFISEDDIAMIAKLGLNCVRVPIWWRAVNDPEYAGTMRYLDNVVTWCSKYNIYVIIDLHGAPGGQTSKAEIVGERCKASLWDDEEMRKATVSWWTNTAYHFSENTTVAGYDLLNEAFSVPFDVLVDFYDRLYQAIRAVDSNHIIIIEDGLQGLHRLPAPSDMNWSNVVYSFHYYPANPGEAFRSPQRILPRFGRISLAYQVPLYVGEFNTIALNRGGAALMLRYCEIFDFYRWPWTFWSYKVISDNRDVNWGLVGRLYNVPGIDWENGKIESLENFLKDVCDKRKYEADPLLMSVFSQPCRPRFDAESRCLDDRIILGLDSAFVLPEEEGDIRIEWNWTPPNVGYWKRGDRVAWHVFVATSGVYELSLDMADNDDGHMVAVWIDGCHVADAPIGNTGGWRKYEFQQIGQYYFSSGNHSIEIGQGDSLDGFINLRSCILQPAAGEAVTPAEDEYLMSPINFPQISSNSSIRVEWLRDPPDFGYWDSGESVGWKLRQYHDKKYQIFVTYSSPNNPTRMRIRLDGDTRLAVTLHKTGGWHDFKTIDLGEIEISSGPHLLECVWETSSSEGAGNLRWIRLKSSGSDGARMHSGLSVK